MTYKYFKYILFSFIIMFICLTNVKAANKNDDKTEKVTLEISQTEKKGCKYEYNGATLSIYNAGMGTNMNQEKGSNYTKASFASSLNVGAYTDSMTSCPTLYAYTNNNGKELILFSKKFTTAELIDLPYKYDGEASGVLSKEIIECNYKAKIGNGYRTFSVSRNPATNDVKANYMGYADSVLNNFNNPAIKEYVSDSVKSWMKNSTTKLECRNDIVIDNCSTDPNAINKLSVDNVTYIRTSSDPMKGSCTQSTNPGSVEVTVNSDDKNDAQYFKLSSMCSDSKIRSVFKFLGNLLTIVKILVPLGLIIFGAISFGKAMISGDDSALKKNAVGFIWKLIAAVVIFVVPTLINLIINVVDEDSKSNDTYAGCSTCLFNPKKC